MRFAMRTAVAVAACVFATASAFAEAPPRAEIQQMKALPHRMSAPVSTFAPGLPAPGALAIAVHKPDVPGGGRGGGGGGSAFTDPALQTTAGGSFGATLLASVEGIGANGSLPPDANLAVGNTQIVEIVNTQFAVYDKTTRTMTLGPVAIHTLFTGLGGMCETNDGGDPIVLFDQMAGRWFISQLEYNSTFTTNLLCTAVSTTSDATGTYTLYEWNFGSYLPDYPKVGVWPDAYYLSANLFYRAQIFTGSDACALDRNAMINGQQATGVCFNPSQASLLPANLDGATLPDAGEPGFFVSLGSNAVTIFKMHVDFVNINNSTLSSVSRATAAFRQACGGGACVPQPSTTQQLDTLADRLMYRLSYRRFLINGSNPPAYTESLLVNHSVQVRSTSNQSGVRWYEIQNPNTTAVIVQQSTFSPDTAKYRWMGSMAQDKQGNMLIGYSTSGAASPAFPGIAYTGRVAGVDPLNQMSTEFSSFTGTGSQTTYSRWGDYTSMAIDPVDDCTFWFVGEYLVTTGAVNWHTRLESLKFPSCVP